MTDNLDEIIKKATVEFMKQAGVDIIEDDAGQFHYKTNGQMGRIGTLMDLMTFNQGFLIGMAKQRQIELESELTTKE